MIYFYIMISYFVLGVFLFIYASINDNFDNKE